MRWIVKAMVQLALVLGVAGAGLAQTPPGPPTLGKLLRENKPGDNADAAGSEREQQQPLRAAGTLVRPKNGVKRPDLDGAWAEYDAAAAKSAQGVVAAIDQQFDAATVKGDLSKAEKWQAIGEKLRKTGELPIEGETKAAVISARNELKAAKDNLAKTYETAIKSLTMEKQIQEAKAVRDEFQEVSKASEVLVGKKITASETSSAKNDAKKVVVKPVPRGRFKRFRLVAKTSSPEGWEAYYRTIELFDSETGKLIVDGKASGMGRDAANAFDNNRETKYRTVDNPGAKEDWIEYEVPNPVAISRIRVDQLGPACNHVLGFEISGSNDGDKWSPIMRATNVPTTFDSAFPTCPVEWLMP